MGATKKMTNITINISGSDLPTDDLKAAFEESLKPIPKNKGECNYHWVRTERSEESPFTITKEQYEKDIEQAKKDVMADHCKKAMEQAPITDIIQELSHRLNQLPDSWYSEHRPDSFGCSDIDFSFTVRRYPKSKS